MNKKIIGIILLILAGMGFLNRLMSGGEWLPHVLGPITLLIIGIILLTQRQKSK